MKIQFANLGRLVRMENSSGGQRSWSGNIFSVYRLVLVVQYVMSFRWFDFNILLRTYAR